MYPTKKKKDPTKNSVASNNKPLTSLPEKRTGDRKDGDPRAFYAKMGVAPKVKGSAYIEMGKTKIMVSILELRELPRQSKKSAMGELACEVKYASFAVRDKAANITAKKEKSISIVLKKALRPLVCRHEFSNFQVDISVTVLQDDGCVISSAILCSGLALVDGGIPSYDVITASTIALREGRILLDPTLEEEELCLMGNSANDHGVIVLSRLDALNQTTELYHIGYISYDLLKDICEKLVNHNKTIAKIVKQIILNNVKDRLEESKEET